MKSNSLKTQRSIYAKFTAKFTKSMRRKQSLVNGIENGGMDGASLDAAIANESRKKDSLEVPGSGPIGGASASIELDRKKSTSQANRSLYGRLEDLEQEEEDSNDILEDEEDEDKARMIERLRNLSHLSTITEQNSPYSTNPGSRRNSKPYPTAEGIFAQDSPRTTSNLIRAKLGVLESGNEAESNAYYPLGSEASESMNRQR